MTNEERVARLERRADHLEGENLQLQAELATQRVLLDALFKGRFHGQPEQFDAFVNAIESTVDTARRRDVMTDERANEIKARIKVALSGFRERIGRALSTR